MSWELYREKWGSHGEFVIDGNLKNVEYTSKLKSFAIPTLITVGDHCQRSLSAITVSDHDECDPSLARQIQANRAPN
ncbi:MAG: proline-specific peptidase [Candidatus Solibacter sp.]|nr:proline-specific peptidase [Candidatus Solibacter sp.]